MVGDNKFCGYAYKHSEEINDSAAGNMNSFAQLNKGANHFFILAITNVIEHVNIYYMILYDIIYCYVYIYKHIYYCFGLCPN